MEIEIYREQRKDFEKRFEMPFQAVFVENIKLSHFPKERAFTVTVGKVLVK